MYNIVKEYKGHEELYRDNSCRNVLRHVGHLVTVDARLPNEPDGLIRFY